jgi:integrase/recombinase XerD
MARGGMRIGEVLKLRMMDVEDCKLFLVSPKSGRQNEDVSIPKKVAARLREYIRTKNMTPDERIFPIGRLHLENRAQVMAYAGRVGLAARKPTE